MQTLSRLRATAALALLAACGAPAAAVLPYAHTGHLYVSMWEADEIAVFAEDGTPVTRFSAVGLDGPRGLAFHPERDELWIASELDDALYVFDGEHRLQRVVRAPGLDGPVGVTFVPAAGAEGGHEIHVGNSDADEILVLDGDGRPLRRFAGPSFDDPSCSALFPDGTLFVADRLGGGTRPGGAVARFGADETFELDFAADGLASTMAVARDPNVPGDDADDTLWVSSGAGTLGLHEFDTAGNLLRSILPADVPGGGDLVPQGIAFADDGRLFVVSYRDAVFEFDGEGNYLSRFPTGPGTSRSTAFRRCDAACDEPAGTGSVAREPAAGETAAGSADGDGSGGGGTFGLCMLASLVVAGRTRRRSPAPVR